MAEDEKGSRGARDWMPVLRGYRGADDARSATEVAITLAGFIASWALAWATLSGPAILTLAVSPLVGLFLVRVFCLLHDCGHASLFSSRRACDGLGRVLGVLTLTPYALWRQTHDTHHAEVGNLDNSGFGEVGTLTVDEYRARGPLGRLAYRAYRHPLFLLGFAPVWVFFLQYRLPFGLWGSGKQWGSTMGTNLAVLALLAGLYAMGGWAPILLIFVPSTWFAAFAGMWMFYAHHQFEEGHFEHAEDWSLLEAAFEGSSRVVLPRWLDWFTANVMIHHVHHLYARIPFYRLPQVMKENPDLGAVNHVTMLDSLRAFRLGLWDARERRLVSFAEAAV